jgi:hypothetical protein
MEDIVILLSVGFFAYGIYRVTHARKHWLLCLFSAALLAFIGTAQFHVTTRDQLRACHLSVAHFLAHHPAKSLTPQGMEKVNSCR